MSRPMWAAAFLLLAAAGAHAASTITVSGQQMTFDNSLDLSARVGGRTLQLLYTLTADGRLSAALVSDAGPGEYAGVSFGRPHRAGVPTVIATTEFVDGYFLDGYETSTCNEGRGQWPISGAALQYTAASGQLVAAFSAQGLAGGQQTIGYTFGPYEGGILEDHTRGGYRYGSTRATLAVSAAAAPTPVQQSAGGGSNGAQASTQTPTQTTTTPAAAAAPAAPARPVRSAASARPFSAWVSEVAAPSWHLMAAFCISWVAAPGALLLLWPFVFDAVADACALLRLRPRVETLQH